MFDFAKAILSWTGWGFHSPLTLPRDKFTSLSFSNYVFSLILLSPQTSFNHRTPLRNLFVFNFYRLFPNLFKYDFCPIILLKLFFFYREILILIQHKVNNRRPLSFSPKINKKLLKQGTIYPHSCYVTPVTHKKFL